MGQIMDPELRGTIGPGPNYYQFSFFGSLEKMVFFFKKKKKEKKYDIYIYILPTNSSLSLSHSLCLQTGTRYISLGYSFLLQAIN
jgi:hypothetical protein